MKKTKPEIAAKRAAQPPVVKAILAIAAEMARRLRENISAVQLRPAGAPLGRVKDSSARAGG